MDRLSKLFGKSGSKSGKMGLLQRAQQQDSLDSMYASTQFVMPRRMGRRTDGAWPTGGTRHRPVD